MNELKNWKTTLIGLILSVSGFIAVSPNHFGGDNALVVELSRYVLAGGFAALGIYSTDVVNLPRK